MIDQGLLAALNHLLAGAHWAQERLRPYAERTACIAMPPFALAFEVTPDGLFAVSPAPTFDVTIRLPADAPLRLLQGLDQVLSVAHVEGNAEFATELSFIFKNLHWDIEEDLARQFGDIPARRITSVARQMNTWQQQARSHLLANVTEYLTHESRLLVTRGEYDPLRVAVRELQAHLAQLETRVGTLT